MKITAKQILNVSNKYVIETDNMSFVMNEDSIEDINNYPEAGSFDYLNEELIMLISFNKYIYVFYDNLFHHFEKDKLKVNYSVLDNVAKLSFEDIVNNKIYEINYSIKDMEEISSIYYTEEEEDVNFGLWLYNVLNNSERIQIIKEYSPHSV
ncbi:hypothetical protein [Flavobacterium sp. WV_118_3]|uniref:hypothetical protein n=1 Tax=Flavobacterium sp. WV_118_3 TaxID=3151764 RepID=UPI00321A0405